MTDIIHPHKNATPPETPTQEQERLLPHPDTLVEGHVQDVGSSSLPPSDEVTGHAMVTEVAPQSVDDVDDLEADDAYTSEKKSGKKALKILAPIVAVGSLAGAFLLGRTGGDDKVETSPAPVSAPASNPNNATPTSTPEKAKVNDRYAPGTERLIKTKEGYDISYGFSPKDTKAGSVTPPPNQDLLEYGRKVEKEQITPAARKKKLLPVAMGECVVIKDTYIRETDSAPHPYYLILVNPVAYEEGNRTTYYVASEDAYSTFAVEKQPDGKRRSPFGEASIVKGDLKGLELWPLPVLGPSTDNSSETPDQNTWGASGSVTYTKNVSDKSSKATVAATAVISGATDFSLSPEQQKEVCTELLQKTNIQSFNE